MRNLLCTLALSLLAFAASPARAQTPANPASPAAREYRVMLVGNGMLYANNLPAMLRAIGDAQGTPILTETYASPGGKLSERLADGHASAALERARFDAIVLQEQGGNLAVCMAGASASRKAPCAASKHAYASFAEQADGAKPLVFATWGPDRGWDMRLQRSAATIARAVHGKVFSTASLFEAMRKAQPDSDPLPDGKNPSIRASLLLALALYRDITGITPTARDLQIRAPLYPANVAVAADRAMENQPALAGDGKVTVVPAALVAPLIQVLADAKPVDEESGRGRRR